MRTHRDGSIFSEMLQEIVQQLRHPKRNIKKKEKQTQTLNPKFRTLPFRRLTCLGIIVHRHHTDPKRMVSLEVQ